MFLRRFLLSAKNLGGRVLKPNRVPTLVALPVALYMLKEAYASCFLGFGETKLAKNKLAGRVNDAEYPANNPIEDRHLFQELTSIQGYVAAVFDGHGGWQMSHFANKHMVAALDKALANNKSKFSDEKEMIVESIKQAFDEVEGKFLEIAREGYAIGFPRMGRVGACALVVVVANNRVYAANAGDSQGLVLEEKDGKLNYTKLNKKLNANSKKQQQRLKALFPAESDIVECRRPKSCYVKGRLQPTRAFGDFRLKYPEFNNPKDFASNLDYQTRLKVFTGPYITHQPEIRVIDLTKDHKVIVMGCDGNYTLRVGLWDELSKQEVTDIADKALKGNKKNQLSKILLDAALQKAASSHTMSVAELKKIPQGEGRRHLHDDVSIITIDLEQQTN